jgi:hypothetical protein
MKPDILIPTCKTDWDISPMIGELFSVDHDPNVFYSCFEEGSAAINRNRCLSMATATIVIMADDDMTGFFPGWAEKHVAPFEKDENIIQVAARLLNTDGTYGAMMGDTKDYTTPLVEVPLAPSACIAFRNDGTRFWEEYLGSGFEDTDFIFQLKEKYPKGKIFVNNEVRLIHTHEMKNQNKYFEHNKAIFTRRFPNARFEL